MEFKRASQFTLAELTELWNQGFSGYFVPLSFTEAQFEAHCHTGDVDLEHSVIAVEGGVPAGFSYLAVRGRRGWIGGVGVAPDFRGKGLAGQIMQEHAAVIRQETDLNHVQLEVFVQNWAQKVYARTGYETTRRLCIMEGRLPEEPTAAGLETGAGAVQEIAPAALLPHSERLHAAWPSNWQREAAHLAKSLPPTARAICTGPAEAPTGYLIYVERSEELVVVLDGAAGESPAVAGQLLGTLAQAHPGATFKTGMEPEGSPLHQAYIGLGGREALALYEMHWQVPDR